MKNIKIEGFSKEVSQIAMGCMRISKMEVKDITTLINCAMENGINFFDHADIYGGGQSEIQFGKSYTGKREDIIIQSKCGIRNGFYDFSKEHIENSIDGSLKRLNTDYIDMYLLHRPDVLMNPEEVAEVLEKLIDTGKVKCIGVSNESPNQIKLLSKYLKHKISVNQLQFSLTNTGMIDSGINVNTQSDKAIDRDGGIFDYCRLENITMQIWSPMQYGFFDGVFIDSPKYPELNKELAILGEKYNVSKTSIATAFILRIPASIQVLTGTTNAGRLKEMCDGTNITLAREEWYNLYKSAGNMLP